ncbi:MAG: hypothetical protein A3G75_16070 [Verrucomicrobia bacterium RIFCSPLOWO2_12_FULL_64_8]|nr:MAG: hypothetical protein A3G75_16070 [Verrucomicrobia bacterium RIFCSPLOWO2_12_FULL_64_8]
MNFKQPTWLVLRWCGSCCASFLCWTFWLALSVLLVVLGWIAVRRQLPVPDFLLRRGEQRLAQSGVIARVDQVVVDPGGRVVLAGLRLYAAGQDDPLVESQAARVQLDPWFLFMGEIRVQEIRLTGTSLMLPAMFSPTGASQAVVRDLDAVLVPEEKSWRIDRLMFRVDHLPVAVRGRVRVAGRPRAGATAEKPSFAQLLPVYLKYAREVALQLPQLQRLDRPRLEVELSPDERAYPRLAVRVYADGLHLTDRLEVGKVMLTSDDLLGAKANPPGARWQADMVAWAGLGRAIRTQGAFAYQLGFGGGRWGVWNADLTAAVVEGRLQRAFGVTAVVPRRVEPWSGLASVLPFRVSGYVQDSTVHVRGEVEVAEKTGRLEIDTAVTPALLDAVVRPFSPVVAKQVALQAPIDLSARLELQRGWKPGPMEADVAARAMSAHEVPLDSVRAHVTYAGTALEVNDVVMRQGDNFARGSYAMDTATLDYRFLLQGRLRPAGIDGWFKAWWPKFWKQFDFSAEAPAADVDIQGRWRDTRLSNVFCGADAGHPVVRGMPFDRVQTRLFARPGYYDVGHFRGERGGLAGTGSFLYLYDQDRSAMRSVEFYVVSGFDPAEPARAIFGEAGSTFFKPFWFAEPPNLHLVGHVNGPAADDPSQKNVHMELGSRGRFTFRHFPLENLRFTGQLDNDDLDLPGVEAVLAGGAVAGRARLTGPAGARKLTFQADLKGSELPGVAAALEEYQLAGQPPPAGKPPDNLHNRTAGIHVDLSLAAEGRYGEPYSFQGEGIASAAGQINLFGMQFDNARAAFKLDGNRLLLPPFKVAGRSAAIEAHGKYLLDAKTLDLTANLFPFQERSQVLTELLGFIFMPLSEVVVFKLTGRLEEPAVQPVLDPRGILKTFTRPLTGGVQAPDQPPPSVTAPVPPAPSSEPANSQPPAQLKP